MLTNKIFTKIEMHWLLNSTWLLVGFFFFFEKRTNCFASLQMLFHSLKIAIFWRIALSCSFLSEYKMKAPAKTFVPCKRCFSLWKSPFSDASPPISPAQREIFSIYFKNFRDANSWGAMRQEMAIFKGGNSVCRGSKNLRLNFDELKHLTI